MTETREAWLERKLNESIDETARLRALAAEILGTFDAPTRQHVRIARAGVHHYDGWQQRAGAGDVPAAFAVDDRVLVTGQDHPWKGHTGTISGPFSTGKATDLKWTVALDDGWSTAAVAEADIRRADR